MDLLWLVQCWYIQWRRQHQKRADGGGGGGGMTLKNSKVQITSGVSSQKVIGF